MDISFDPGARPEDDVRVTSAALRGVTREMVADVRGMDDLLATRIPIRAISNAVNEPAGTLAISRDSQGNLDYVDKTVAGNWFARHAGLHGTGRGAQDAGARQVFKDILEHLPTVFASDSKV